MSIDSPSSAGHLAYPAELVAILRGLAVDRMSLIDTVEDAPLLEIASAVVDLLTNAAGVGNDALDLATRDTAGRILHVALSRGLIRAAD